MRSEQLATKPGQFSENQVIFARIFIEQCDSLEEIRGFV
jgi:hypothetical protein